MMDPESGLGLNYVMVSLRSALAMQVWNIILMLCCLVVEGGSCGAYVGAESRCLSHLTNNRPQVSPWGGTTVWDQSHHSIAPL